MKKLIVSILIISGLFSTPARADFDFMKILDVLANMYGVNLDMQNSNVAQLKQLEFLSKSLGGKFDLGSKYYSDNTYAWGGQANTWRNIVAMSKNGSGNGQLGKTILSIAKDFSMHSVKSPNSIENEYYQLQAATALSSRSASELAYEQAVNEEKTLKKLHGLIDTIESEKEASDFNNRMASEQAMTSLQQTKLLSILVQQAAVNSQVRANRAREDMEFFNMS